MLAREFEVRAKPKTVVPLILFETALQHLHPIVAGLRIIHHTEAMRSALTPIRLLIFALALCSWCPLPTWAEDTPAANNTLSVNISDAADQRIEQAIQRRLRQNKNLLDVQVSVDAGVVTLKGSALTSEAINEAIALAQRTEGVAAVNSELTENWQLRQRVRPTLQDGWTRLRSFVSLIPLFLVAVGIVVLFGFLAQLLANWDPLYNRLARNRFVRDQLRQAVRIIVFVIGVLIALELLDATALVGALLGTAGVVGIALGFAFRDLVENHIASILLSLRQPFAPGDHVVIGDHEGKVIRLTSRATILMTLDGNHLRIPNADVYKGVILNYTRNPQRRFSFGVGVGVNEDLQRAQQLGVAVLQFMDGIQDEPPPMALIEELGESNVLIRFFGWVDQTKHNFIKVKSEAIRQVKKALDDAGIDMPEPIYRVQLNDQRGSDATAAEQSTETPEVRAKQSLQDTLAGDLSAGDSVDNQIARERADTQDVDLLDPAAPKE